MKVYCKSYELGKLIDEPTYHKNSKTLLSIDLILLNFLLSFENLCVIETGLSAFHTMTVFKMKSTFQKLKPKVTFYTDFGIYS